MNCRDVPVARLKREIDCVRKRNDEQTEFNIVMGLCVGHDSLFLKYSNAPCTVLAAKDRLLGHNPLAAIYTIDSYYRSLKP
jgi:uncharacterized metal-binding protein